mgnify:CR=1 FL=1
MQWPAVSLFVIVIMSCCQHQSRKKQTERVTVTMQDHSKQVRGVMENSANPSPALALSHSNTCSSPPPTVEQTPPSRNSGSSEFNNSVIRNNICCDNSSNSCISLPPSWRSGEIISFESFGAGGELGCSWDLLIERLPDSFLHSQERDREGGGKAGSSLCVALALPSQPYNRLRISNMQTGALDWSGKAADRDSCWVVTSSPPCSPSSPHTVTLTHNAFSKKKGQGRVYSFVLASRDGGWIAQPLPLSQPPSQSSSVDPSVSVAADSCHTHTTTDTAEIKSESRLPRWRVQALQPRRTHRRACHHQPRRSGREGKTGIESTASGDVEEGEEEERIRVPAQPLTDTQLRSFVHEVIIFYLIQCRDTGLHGAASEGARLCADGSQESH